MNKYDKEWQAKELDSRKRDQDLLNNTMLQIRKRLIDLYPNTLPTLSIDNEELLSIIMMKINQLDYQYTSIIIDELQNSSFCKSSALLSCLRIFNNSFINVNKEKQKNLIESMQIIGLIQNITNVQDKVYKLITPDNHSINFTRVWNTEDLASLAYNNCHSISQVYLIKSDKYSDYIANVCRTKEIFGEKIYHSFITEKDTVYDLAMNLIMKYKDYKVLFNPQIIAQFDKDELDNSIEQLRKSDKDFSTSISNQNELLKCAMAKQMKKEKRYYL